MEQQDQRYLSHPEITAAFTGYRPQKLPNHGSLPVQQELGERLEKALRLCIGRGYTIFLNGCMSGWDILAAETVLALRETVPAVACVTVAPFRKDYFENDNWTPEWKKRALSVFERSDWAFSLSDHYSKGIYYHRDRFLVDHASLVLCYYDGKSGGTKYTVDYAEKTEKELMNLADRDRGTQLRFL